MAELIKNLGTAITWILGLFGDFMKVIQDNPILLYGVLLGIVISAIAIVLRVLKKFGIRSKKR